MYKDGEDLQRHNAQGSWTDVVVVDVGSVIIDIAVIAKTAHVDDDTGQLILMLTSPF